MDDVGKPFSKRNAARLTKDRLVMLMILPSAVSPCIMSLHYTGGCSVHRGIFGTLLGFHEYSGGKS